MARIDLFVGSWSCCPIMDVAIVCDGLMGVCLEGEVDRAVEVGVGGEVA